jgi:hypothetical protein
MVFNLEHGSAQNCWRFRVISNFIIARFAYSKNGVAPKKVIAKSDRSGLIKKIFEAVVRTICNVAFGGEREVFVFARAEGIAGRSLRERHLMSKKHTNKKGE